MQRVANEAVVVPPHELETELVDRIVKRIETMGAASRSRPWPSPAAAEPSLRDTIRDVVEEVVRRGESVVGTIDPNMVPMLDAISRSVQESRDHLSEEQITKLVDVFVGSKDPTAEVRADIDADNAKARIRFIERIPSFTSEQVAQLAGHQAKNKSQTASRWKGEGRIFSVPWRGNERYPAFQFRDGRPLPIVGEIIRALPAGLSYWEIAFWFVSANPWLDGAAPMDSLEAGALDAARSDSEKVIG